MMDRRRFLLVSLAGALAGSRSVEAQQARTVARVGVLGNIPPTDAEGARVWGAFNDGLRQLGYAEGQNLLVRHLSSEGRLERLPSLAAELVQWKPDVIVAANTLAARVARDATQAIAIVCPALSPVGSGLITSLARPGGNVTGLSLLAPEMGGKLLQLLQQIAPRVRRIGVLWNPTNEYVQLLLDQVRAAAPRLTVDLHVHETRQPDDIHGAFMAMSQQRLEALLVLSDAMLILQRTRIADLAARARLPAMYSLREHMGAGGLAFYGPSLADNFRRAASYVQRILGGAKPAELPVEQPTKFDLVINLKTARALRLSITPSLLARADQVIE